MNDITARPAPKADALASLIGGTPTRLASDALECLAYEKGRPIEFDNALNVAVVKIGHDTYYAELAEQVSA